MVTYLKALAFVTGFLFIAWCAWFWLTLQVDMYGLPSTATLYWAILALLLIVVLLLAIVTVILAIVKYVRKRRHPQGS